MSNQKGILSTLFAIHAPELGLRLSSFLAKCAHVRQHRLVPCARTAIRYPPLQFSLGSSCLEPALVENRLVQTDLGPDVLSWVLNASRRRLALVTHLQVFDTRLHGFDCSWSWLCADPRPDGTGSPSSSHDSESRSGRRLRRQSREATMRLYP